MEVEIRPPERFGVVATLPGRLVRELVKDGQRHGDGFSGAIVRMSERLRELERALGPGDGAEGPGDQRVGGET